MRNMLKVAALVAAVIVVGGFVTAQADTVTISAGINGGTATVEDVGTGGNASASFSIGGWNVSDVSAQGLGVITLPNLLDSSSINTSTSGTTNTLDIYITETGITSPTGLDQFTSSFTENSITSGLSATMYTYLGGATLDDATFTAIGTSVLSDSTSTGNLYSVTEEYVISSNGVAGGSSNATIDLNVTPTAAAEPSTLLMMVGGLFGLALLAAGKRLLAPCHGSQLA